MPGQIGSPCIGMENIDVGQATVHDELSSALHLFSAAFHTDHPARGTHTFGEKAQTTLWATADLDRSPSFPHTHLIEQPARIMGKFVSLPLQTLLLRLTVT